MDSARAHGPKLAVALMLGTVVLAGCLQGGDTTYGSKIGDRAHPFTLTTIDGETVTLKSLVGDVGPADTSDRTAGDGNGTTGGNGTAGGTNGTGNGTANETNRTTDGTVRTARRVAVVDLMGVNCPPCRAQTREFVKWHDRYDTSGVRVLSVDFGSARPGLGANNEQEIHDFRDEFDAQWDFAADTDNVAKNYQIIGLPTLYIIDQEGVIQVRHSGILTAGDFEETVRPLVG